MDNQKKILIIEDDKDLRKLLADALLSENFAVVATGNGTEGLALAKAERPDLVLVDLDIPGTEGLSVIKQLRQSGETNPIPVIIFSNSADITNVSKAMEEGVLYYLPKSDWELPAVVSKVKEALKVS